MQQLISISAQFPPQLEAAARIEAARQRISRAELVRRAVIEYLKQLEAIPASQPQQGGNNVQKI